MSEPDLVAFPGAEGAGRFAVGGRGGQVIHVTTLADAGAGSLRAAVETAAPRMIVFDVSGTIALASPLKIEHPFVTIAGQTATGDGITLRDQPLIVAADHVIIRYVRSRLGDESRVQGDAITITKGRNIILDHVSAGWSTDEALSLSSRFDPPENGFYDVTVQWSIISESLDHSSHEKGRHGYGTLVRASNGSRVSFHHNLWAHHQARMPRPGNYKDVSKDSEGPLIEFANNVFYNWGGDPEANHTKDGPLAGKGRIDGLAAGYNADTNSVVTYNFIGNVYRRGPDSRAALAFFEHDRNAKAFFADNSIDGQIPSDPWSLVAGPLPTTYKLATAADVALVGIEPSLALFEKVLQQAGASLARDPVDMRVVAETREGKGRIIDSQQSVGGWPTLKSSSPPLDTDRDGMSDAWESANGLNAKNPDDGAEITPVGYTQLEVYLDHLTHQ
jgi:hypothetical protein